MKLFEIFDELPKPTNPTQKLAALERKIESNRHLQQIYIQYADNVWDKFKPTPTFIKPKIITYEVIEPDGVMRTKPVYAEVNEVNEPLILQYIKYSKIVAQLQKERKQLQIQKSFAMKAK